MRQHLATVIKQLSFETVFVVLCAGTLVFSYGLIPSLGGSLYASPDETAVALATERLLSSGSPAIPEPLAIQYPWLHARSWVSHGEAIVPVGFLGWPLFLTPWRAILGETHFDWAGVLLLISSFYPLFQLLRKRFSARAAWGGLLVAGASPMMIFYANRSLFPNVGLMALAMWGLWLLEHEKLDQKRVWIAGLVVGLTCTIRPIEALWLLPWWLAAFTRETTHKRGKEYLPIIVAAVATIAIFLRFNQKTYGSFWEIGYWLRDNLPKNTDSILKEAAEKTSLSLSSFFPFGIHPHNILWNLKAFGVTFLWPSILILSGALLFFLKTNGKPFFQSRAWIGHPVVLGAWTLGSLLVVYGSGIYQDHVQVGAITVGNSFLRYLLPVALLTGLAAAYLIEKLSPPRWITTTRMILFLAFGLHAALYKDDEGIIKTRRELKRYAQVLETAKTFFPPGSVIFSERSDKIFASYTRAVSPLPPVEEMARLVHDQATKLEVGLYARPLSQYQRDAFRRQGVEVIDKGVFAREHLFHLVPR